MAQNNTDREVRIPSRFIGVRLQPEAQRDLYDALEAGLATETTEAIHKALKRLGRSARRLLGRAA